MNIKRPQHLRIKYKKGQKRRNNEHRKNETKKKKETEKEKKRYEKLEESNFSHQVLFVFFYKKDPNLLKDPPEEQKHT